MHKITPLFFALLLCSTVLQAQTTTPPIQFNNSGIVFTHPDSTFSMQMRFRMQNRVAYTTVSESDLSAETIEARVRRMRLRWDGFMIDPRLTYMVQLSFSRGDMDWVDNDNSAVNSSPNVLRDAMVYYQWTEHFSLNFGQGKLPGNRQRVVSSGDLQFADRSIVNATFNIDRDFGFQGVYQNQVGPMAFALRGAVSSGEGRNAVNSDAGLAYTGRVELLPFGKFTRRGDYFEGDLEREPKPKLSLAGGYHVNENAQRTAGTLGRDLYAPADLSSVIADMLFKYRGFAFAAEYLNRRTDTPITTNEAGETRVIYTGEGTTMQTSYIFKNNYEVAARYSIITPFTEVRASQLQRQEMGMVVTKYLRKHRVKLQAQVFYNISDNLTNEEAAESNWTGTFQIELGI